MDQVWRKTIRLPAQSYDAGWYFVTICTENRKNILAKIEPIVGADDSVRPCVALQGYAPVLTQAGVKVKTCLERLNDEEQGIRVDSYVICRTIFTPLFFWTRKRADRVVRPYNASCSGSNPFQHANAGSLVSKHSGSGLFMTMSFAVRKTISASGNTSTTTPPGGRRTNITTLNKENTMLKNVKCARCVRCGKEYEAVPNLTNCSCGGILDIIYDYDYIKAHFTKETLKNRNNPTMWRYRELLPVEETTPDTPLRVGWSPLYEEPRLAAQLGLKKLWVKDDGINPTASLKDRASAMAVAKAQEAGAKIIACSSTGNAASSLAGNAAAAGLKTYIFVPERAPKGKVAQLMIFGANVISVKGNYEETFKMSAEAIDKWGWYNRNAAINPYLSEGKKTVALEIAEQLNWEMPDYLAISVGDGCTIAGVWKGLKDLYAIGFIDKLPRLISAQSTGCYPINRAIQENKPWEPMEENTIADSISVGVPRNADKALMAIRESNGIAVNVTDEEILAAQKLLGRTCGVFGEPAGVTGTAALKKACEQGLIPHDATVVSVVTGNGLKDVANAIKSAGEPINIKPDLDLMVEEFAKRGVTVE